MEGGVYMHGCMLGVGNIKWTGYIIIVYVHVYMAMYSIKQIKSKLTNQVTALKFPNHNRATISHTVLSLIFICIHIHLLTTKINHPLNY